MGKQGGFLEHGRKEPGYRPVQERILDFKRTECMLSEKEITDQAARCMECGTPFCHSTGCPLCNIIPEFNDMVYQGRWREAADLLFATSAFPEFTARLCPAPCEASCVLGINDDPVAIRQIEFYIIEKAFEEGYVKPQPPKSRSAKSVAVVGAGPTGLSAAFSLNRAGFSVVVFDNEKEPGGILRYGIPDFKLEKSVLERRIDLLREEGIEFEMNVEMGTDLSYHYLEKRFDAIFLGCGARQPRDLSVPGREKKGIHFAMEFLVCQNKLNAGEAVPPEELISAEGKNCIVIGGGDTGSDCIGTCVRQKVRQIVQFEILPQPPKTRASDNPWPEWHRILKESSSHQEGGERLWCVNTREFPGDGDHVTAVRACRVNWAKDKEGKWRMEEEPGSEFEIEADLVLLAMGFSGPGNSHLIDMLELKKTKRGTVSVDEHYMTSRKGVFAAGDMVQGQSLIVRAMNDGKKAASQIARYLKGNDKTQK